MKTLIIYNPVDTEILFAILDGDLSKYHGLVINSDSGELINECISWLFKEGTGDFNFKLIPDVSLLENKEWDKVAIITWLP